MCEDSASQETAPGDVEGGGDVWKMVSSTPSEMQATAMQLLSVFTRVTKQRLKELEGFRR